MLLYFLFVLFLNWPMMSHSMWNVINVHTQAVSFIHCCFFMLHFFYDHLTTLHRLCHLSLNPEGCWGTTDDFTTSFLSTCLLPDVVFPSLLLSALSSSPFHCALQDVFLARPDERETCPYHCGLHLFTMVRRSLCGPTAWWILAWTSLLVTWSLYEMRSILRLHLNSMAHHKHTDRTTTTKIYLPI